MDPLLLFLLLLFMLAVGVIITLNTRLVRLRAEVPGMIRSGIEDWRPRVEEEIEAVANILGPDTILTGFYSYGEISPLTPETPCCLHNQTMTITWIGEAT